MSKRDVSGSSRKISPSHVSPDPSDIKLAVLRSQGGNWQKLVTGARSHPLPATNIWEMYRKDFPELKLSPVLGDDLSLLLSGNPDPRLSLKYWKLVQKSLRDSEPEKAAKQLLGLLKHHLDTFRSSGWTKTSVAKIVLEYDVVVAQKFVKSYWKEVQYVPSRSREAALKAISWLDGDHRKHWLTAAGKITRLYKDNPKPKEPDRVFAARATVWYIESGAKNCTECLSIDILDLIAQTVFQYPKESSGYIADYALAELFNTSHSTLIHLRAELKKR
jgi:hypothetical protein